MIKLQNISLGYGSKTLLDNASASFDRASLTALIGRNGSGKSSLLRGLAGLNDHCRGEVILDGKGFATLSTKERARLLSFVNTQRPAVSNMSSRDIVAMGRMPHTGWTGRLSKEDERIVDQSLEWVGMSKYAARYIDTLSDGECQRIMIARALAQDTPVILLDEPTSFLDIPNRHELVKLLARLAHEQHKCVIFSTHELDIALSSCDSIALIDNPRLIHRSCDDVKQSGDIQRVFGIDIPC